MIKITGLTADAFQKFKIADPNGGGDISVKLSYRPRVQRWFIDITFGTFILNGYKVLRNPNILAKWSNVIPFGLTVTVSDNFEPFVINDFSSDRVQLYLLTTAEVAEVETMISEGYTVP
jgi:hypothetical protein